MKQADPTGTVDDILALLQSTGADVDGKCDGFEIPTQKRIQIDLALCPWLPGTPDCNNNGIRDQCELAEFDCNNNANHDECDVASGISKDCNGNTIPDECENDCNCNSVDDADELGGNDCNTNLVPDECDLASGTSFDCDVNDVPDECESPDCSASLGVVTVNSGGTSSGTGARSGAGAYGLVASTAQSGGVGVASSATYQVGDGFWFASLPAGCGACRLHADVFPFSGGAADDNPVGNCVVDLDDILTILAAFAAENQCGPDFPGTVNMFPCDQVCAEGVVDLDDILSTLAAFSGTFACDHPCPGGACCFGGGSCQDWDGSGTGTTPLGGMSETSCAEAGGSYYGNGTTCDDVSCP
jgi:hypothetical protein